LILKSFTDHYSSIRGHSDPGKRLLEVKASLAWTEVVGGRGTEKKEIGEKEGVIFLKEDGSL